ncbi:bifunctional aminoglycoside phosphotransferase/ATP-binding protein [Pontibacter saemangeumensis]|uniref:Bifunctional aminoglycoside phosphotransferase/ATP-binding protein n=1 Tax=Pontibacter saemangeumensis TaxID=1084525 RepID=A0ABP8LW96_9BACT
MDETGNKHMATLEDSTERMIAFLRQPSAYPHRPPAVEIRQTHASVLAIAPPYVYKVKKHVNLGFLDFTRLSERKENCERERRLNSRLCPELYIGVLPIASKDNRLFFGAEGRIVEYALQMRQLPEGFFLDQLLQSDQVTPATLDLILQKLKRFYEEHPPAPSVSAYGEAEKVREVVEGNLIALKEHTGEIVQEASLEAVQNYCARFFADNQALFEKRVQEQRIRDCHGDLHLDHIHIWQGKVCIYDCIEFNDRFRYIDVASDMAFLAMDFDFHGRPDLASYITSRLASLLHDPDLALLSDFYKCYRACVRAKVECITSQEPEVPAIERQRSREKARRYGSLALHYALFGSQPAVLVVCGRSGSGKSTIAGRLAELLGWEYVSSDITRKALFDIPQHQRSSPEMRANLYAQQVTDHVYQILLNQTRYAVMNQRSIVVDASFGQPRHRALFGQGLSRAQVPFLFIEMQASDETLRKRLAKRDKSRQVVSDARFADFELLRQLYHEPNEVAPGQLLRINAEKALGRIEKEILQQLSVLIGKNREQRGG